MNTHVCVDLTIMDVKKLTVTKKRRQNDKNENEAVAAYYWLIYW